MTSTPQTHPKVINVPFGAQIKMDQVLQKLRNWEPDLFIAKVDAYQNIVPIHIDALQCPKILILGDTQHGEEPLQRMLKYAQQEKYDFYITDHKKHHLWYYWLGTIF